MPVTAKLSRRFYEQFGDDLVTELVDWFNAVDDTYRSDLQELNELNFARFDAKLEQRFAQQDAKWEQRFAHLDGKWERRFAELEIRVERGFSRQNTLLVRWMFAFWSGSTLTLAGLMIALTRLR